MARIQFIPYAASGGSLPYTPAVPNNWRTPVPTTVGGALDSLAARPVVTEATANRTLTVADNDVLILCTNAGGCTVAVPNTLPQGFRCLLAQIGAAAVQLVGTATLVKPASSVTPAQTAEQGATIGLQVTVVGTALVYGNLA